MKFRIIVRWKNATGRKCHEIVEVQEDSRHEAEIVAENTIASKYANVYELKALRGN